MFSSIIRFAGRKHIPIPLVLSSGNALPVLSRDQSRLYHDGSSSTGQQNHATNLFVPLAALLTAVAMNHTVNKKFTHCEPTKRKDPPPYSAESNQKYFDGMFLPYNGSDAELRKWRECQCGFDKLKCKSLTTGYKEIGDIRGKFGQIPTYGPFKKRTATTINKKRKIERWMTKLDVKSNLLDSASKNNRDQSNQDRSKTRSASATVKQERRYVAWHHFHPAAICCGNYNGKVEIPKQFVKDFIQKDCSDNGY